MTDNTKASDTELRRTTKRNEKDAAIVIIECNDNGKKATTGLWTKRNFSLERGLLLTPLPPNRAKQSHLTSRRLAPIRT